MLKDLLLGAFRNGGDIAAVFFGQFKPEQLEQPILEPCGVLQVHAIQHRLDAGLPLHHQSQVVHIPGNVINWPLSPPGFDTVVEATKKSRTWIARNANGSVYPTSQRLPQLLKQNFHAIVADRPRLSLKEQYFRNRVQVDLDLDRQKIMLALSKSTYPIWRRNFSGSHTQ